MSLKIEILVTIVLVIFILLIPISVFIEMKNVAKVDKSFCPEPKVHAYRNHNDYCDGRQFVCNYDKKVCNYVYMEK